MNKFLLSAFAIATLSLSAFGQNNKGAQKNTIPLQRNCGTEIPDQAWEAWFSQKVAEFEANLSSNKAAMVNYTIPVIVHILHNGDAVGVNENISLAQVQSQITTLNNDYAGTNSDISSVPSVFQSAKAGNTGIQFCLAKVDPNGNTLTETGIERINWSSKGWTNPNSFTSSATLQSYFDGTIKPNSIWDPTKYLNIWIAEMSGSGLLGYASFPAGTGLTGLSGIETATTSGVVINYQAFGNIGTAAAPYNKGRTATHEIGHWLGLRHIWGDGTCATDYCNDTPPANTSNFSCPTHPYNVGTCTGNTTGEMFMNYMDYTDDACMYMFTANQATRMQTAMANGTYRAPLNTSGKCNTPFALDAGISNIVNPANGTSGCNTSITPVVTLTNYGSTTLTSCTITYQLDGGATQTFSWTGSLTSGNAINVAMPAITVTAAAHTYTATATSPNGGTDQNAANNSSASSFTVISAPAGSALPFSEGFQGTTFVPTGWTYTAPNAANKWARVTTAGGFGTSTASAKMDNFSGSTDITGQRDPMITPAISCVGANSTLKLKFDVAYARYNASTNDSLNVWISTDCQATWTKIYTKGGTGLATAADVTTAFTPTATQWRKDSVSLSSYAGLTPIYLKFESVSNWGNNLYLDNINLSYTAATAAPVANFTASATTVCVGQTVTLTDNSTNSPTSWAWTMTGGSPSSSTSQNPTVSYATAGSYTVTLVASNSGGSNSTSKTITVNALPNANAGIDQTITCASASVTLNGSSTTGGATFSWSGPSGFTSASATPSVTTAGTYTLTVTANGCSATDAAIVNTNTTAPNANAGADKALTCSATSVTLNGSSTTAGVTYSWSGPSAFTSTSATPSVSAAGTYTLTVTNPANGCTATDAAVVTSNTTAPNANAGADKSLTCASTSVTLNGSSTTAGVTYSWSGPSAFTSTSATPSVAAAGTYTLTVTNPSNGCTATDAAIVTSNTTAPNANAGADQSISCATGSATLSGSSTTTGVTYSWSGPSAFTASTATATATVAGTYTLTVTNTSNGCTATDAAVVSANTTSPNANAGADQTLTCAAASVTLSGSSTTSGVTYSWSGPAGFTASTATASASVAGTYTLTVTNTGNGCTSTDQAIVSSNTTAPNANAGPNKTISCTSTSVTLNGSSTTNGVTYSWSGPAGFTASTAGITATVAGNYTLTVTNPSNGCTATDVAVVNSNTTAPNANAGADQTLTCAAVSVTLSGSSTTNGVSYSWSGPSGFTASTANATATLPGTYTLTVTTNSNGCTSTDVAVVNSNTTVPNVDAGADQTISCSTTSVTLNGLSTTPGANFSWSGPSGFTDATATPSTSTFGGYELTVTDPTNGCSATDSVYVLQNTTAPSVTFTVSSAYDTLCVNGPAVDLSTFASPAGGTFTGNGVSGNNFDPAAAGAGSQSVTYTYTDSNNGCAASASQSIVVDVCSGIKNIVSAQEVNIYPNPNNGNFMLSVNGFVAGYTLEIMDGLGRQVYAEKAKSTVSKSINLNNMAQGVYMVRITTQDNQIIKRMIIE